MWRGLKKIIVPFKKKTLPRWLTEGLNLFQKNETSFDKILGQHLDRTGDTLTCEIQRRWLLEFKALIHLRALFRLATMGSTSDPDFPLQELEAAFLPLAQCLEPDRGPEDFTFDELSDAAKTVSGLLWQINNMAKDSSHPLCLESKSILELHSVQVTDELIEIMQRQEGIPFLLLNSVKRKNWKLAKSLGYQLLSKEIILDEETRVCLYWISEILWFSQSQITVSDFETAIRYLYHLCFINPERAGFLEIDSQFFSQFENVNELAQEGLLFKETLIEQTLALWEQQGTHFDTVFTETLQLVSQQKNKIYQHLDLWKQWWSREKTDFEKAVLFCVEGNLQYVSKRYVEALDCYNRALRLDGHLRPALLNRVFCLAQLSDQQAHEKTVDDLLERHSLFPSNKIACANSYLLLNKLGPSQVLVSELAKEVEGWESKADYFQSVFCLDHGLHEKALYFAKLAFEKEPEDQRYGFHLSRCLKELGRTQEALKIVSSMSLAGPEWLLFYRFTLERDAGLLREAQQSLSALSDHYFDDPQELQEALDFARMTQDLNLLRRLKSQVS